MCSAPTVWRSKVGVSSLIEGEVVAKLGGAELYDCLRLPISLPAGGGVAGLECRQTVPPLVEMPGVAAEGREGAGDEL